MYIYMYICFCLCLGVFDCATYVWIYGIEYDCVVMLQNCKISLYVIIYTWCICECLYYVVLYCVLLREREREREQEE